MEANKKKLSLTTKIFIALIVGALCGVLLHYIVPNSSFKQNFLIEGLFYIVLYVEHQL